MQTFKIKMLFDNCRILFAKLYVFWFRC